jgi:Family of unknown function (DUF6084)
MPGAATIPAVSFAVLEAAPLERAAAPTLRFALRADGPPGLDIRAILLDVQIQIAARRRPYADEEHERLHELFGPTDAWGSTLRTLLWARTSVTVPRFSGSTVVDALVPCTYDLEVLASRYLDALTGGDVPLELVFSGTVMHVAEGGALQVTRIPWDLEAEYALPLEVWRATMDQHFPGTAWLRVQKETFDRLAAFRARRALPTWEAALDALLDGEEERRDG